MSVAVIVPVYRDTLDADEHISLRHLDAHLGGYERVVLHPDTMPQPPVEGRSLCFPSRCFDSTESYSAMLLSEKFYRACAAWEYVLIYQLDALVFSDQLRHWCAQGYDYIGAPVHLTKTNPHSQAFTGNGGFSLRRVEAFLRVLTSKRYGAEHISFARDFAHATLPDAVTGNGVRRALQRARILRQVRCGVAAYTKAYTLNEDLFWSLRARLFDPRFLIAPVHVAAEFAFENHPELWYSRVGGHLPFGCHAWAKWNRNFWIPYLRND